MNEATALERIDTAFPAPEPTPKEKLAAAADMATPLAKLIDDQQLFKAIRGKKYVFVEGWTTLAALNGCTPREVSNEDIGGGVYEAVVELVNADGRVIGRASAECGAPDEYDNNGKLTWSERPAYARRSMANTRATSKVCRQVFSWIMVLAGYAGTPAEEMPQEDKAQRQQSSSPPRQSGSHEWDGQLKFKTGKNKGKTWAEMNTEFLNWAVDQGGNIREMATKEIARRAKLEAKEPEVVDAEPVEHEPFDDREIPF